MNDVLSPHFYRIESFAISDVGHARPNNEDAWKILPEANFFVLADGMGGHNAGEVASGCAVDSLTESIHSILPEASIEEVCVALREGIRVANKKVFETAQSHPEYRGMGTTLSCFILREHHLVYAHVGDSRLYRYREGLEQLTEDHSLCNTLSSWTGQGHVRSHPRHVITRAIGSSPTVYPDIGVITLNANDLYILCSDGLSDYVEKSKISSVLSRSSNLKDIGNQLMKIALEKGGNDNITFLLVKLKVPC